MKRRELLRLLGGSGLLVALTACAHVARNFLPLGRNSGSSPGADLDPDGVWREGVAFARWSPSVHNIQPWRIRVTSPLTGEVYYDPKRLLPNTDATSAFSTIGMAIFVEYFAIAIRARGYAVDVNYEKSALSSERSGPTLFASLSLRPETITAPVVDRQLIMQRRTSRVPYDGQPVDAQVLRSIAATGRAHGQEFNWSSDSSNVNWLMALNRDMLFEDLQDSVTRTELQRWIRFTDEQAETARDGLWSRCLNVPGWLLQAFFEKPSTWSHGWRRKICGSMLMKTMRGTRTIAWISGPFAGTEDWINCGVMLGRCWLELTRQGIGLHPFGTLITNRSARAQMNKKFSIEDNGKQLWLVFRVGKSAMPPRSLRRDSSAIFLDPPSLEHTV